MHIVHIASEMAPIAKVGGLADVILGLSRELAHQGHQIEIILPKYACIDYNEIHELHVANRDLLSYWNGGWFHNTIWAGTVEGLKVYLIESHTPAHYFGRNRLYGYEDDIERFTYFSRAALEFLLKEKMSPDILHIHEWQTALVGPLYWDLYKELGLTGPRVVFTIHNLEYQGQCSTQDLDRIGLKGIDYLQPHKMQDNHNPELINLMKGGIIYSNAVNTVSPTYAEEIKSSIGGRFLDKTLNQNASKFRGILNGLDYTFWNPATDRYLPAHFSIPARLDPEQEKSIFAIKKQIKTQLRERLSLAYKDCPIVGSITRLVPQKGVELLKHAIFRTLEKGGQFILLGTAPTNHLNEEFQTLKLHFTDNPNVHLELHHHEELAHMIFAGSDMFIVPSIFEPCGLTQLIAMRYGTIPIVRKTGGLADTVFDVDFSEKPFKYRNGYVFDHADATGVNSALDRAIKDWFHQPGRWQQLVLNALTIDFSWNQPAKQYLDMYEKACQ